MVTIASLLDLVLKLGEITSSKCSIAIDEISRSSWSREEVVDEMGLDESIFFMMVTTSSSTLPGMKQQAPVRINRLYVMRSRDSLVSKAKSTSWQRNKGCFLRSDSRRGKIGRAHV